MRLASGVLGGSQGKTEMETRRKKLKLAVVSASAAASAVEQVINLNPSSFVLETSEPRYTHGYLDKRYQEEDDELNSIFFQSAMLSCSLALGGDTGWWVKPRVPAWFDKFLLEVNDRESWVSALSMSKETFLWVCAQLQPLLNKKVTKFRYPISVPCRLGAALYRLTTGADLQEISEKFGIGVSSSQSCITDTVKAINEHFGNCIGITQLEESMAGFFSKCELLNCVGAIGTLNIQVMASSGLDITDCSLSLQAVCDTSYRFLDIFCGSPQDVVHPQSRGLLKTKESFMVSGDQMEHQYYLVGNSSFPLLPWLLVPYTEEDSEMPAMTASFNKRHALAVSHIRQSFGILKETFKILSKCVKHNAAFVPRLVTACCILHNVLLDRKEILLDAILQGLGLSAYEDEVVQVSAPRGTPEEMRAKGYRDHLAEIFFSRDL